MTRTGGKCEYCDRQVSIKDPESRDYATIDHVVALVNGGRDSPENLRLACHRCNQEKGSGVAVDVFLSDMETPKDGET